MYSGMVDKDTALLHHLLQMTKAQRISCVPAGAHQHHFERIVQSLEHPAQFGDHRGFGHVLHPGILTYRRLPRQNPVKIQTAPTPHQMNCSRQFWQRKQFDPDNNN